MELILPVDFVCSSKFGDDGEIQEGDMSTGVPEGFLGLDIGPKSIEMNDEARAFAGILRRPEAQERTPESTGS